MAPQLSILKGKTRPIPATLLHKAFEECVVDQPVNTNALAQVSENNNKDIKLTYEKLNMRANQLANGILACLPQPVKTNADGDYVIVVSMKPSIDLIVTLLAVWKTGAAYMAIEPSSQFTFVEHALEEVEPLLIIYDREHENASMFSCYRRRTFSALQKLSANIKSTNILDRNVLGEGKHDLAIILFTSGSMGRSKGVRLKHCNIMNRLLWQWETFPYTETEKSVIFKTPIAFVDSVSEIWGPLLLGLQLVVVPKEVVQNPEKFIDVLTRYKIERIVLIPSLLRAILLFLRVQPRRGQLARLALFISSGEVLPIKLARQFYAQFSEKHHRLCNFYGTTETCGDVSYCICAGREAVESMVKVPIGIPLYNSVIYILDNDLRPVKNGLHGDIYVSGYSVCAGYVKKREVDRFIPNWFAPELEYSLLFNTGDTGCYRNGVLYFRNRSDHEIKVRGNRVDLDDIEEHIQALKSVDRVFVTCYHAGEEDQSVVAYVTKMESKQALSSVELEKSLESVLPNYSMPRIIILQAFPLLLNGKIDQKHLLELYENMESRSCALAIDYQNVEDSKKIVARDLFETIKNAVGKSMTADKISVKSNFFKLGGNSMNSMQVVADLKQKGYYINISHFLKAKTLHDVLNKLFNYHESNITMLQDTLQKQDFSDEYFSRRMQQSDFLAVTFVLANSMYEKGKFENLLKPTLIKDHFYSAMELCWPNIINHGLSFVVHRHNSDKVIGASINYDARLQPRVDYGTNVLGILAEFLDQIRDSVVGHSMMITTKILHNCLMVTSLGMSDYENVSIMYYMETEVERVARDEHFNRIYTLNTCALSRQLGDALGYIVIQDVPINEFVYHDGTKPFNDALSALRGTASVKYLS